MLKKSFIKLGWHKQHIIQTAHENGKFGWLMFSGNKQTDRLVEWGWLVQTSEWGFYKLTEEGREEYEANKHLAKPDTKTV